MVNSICPIIWSTEQISLRRVSIVITTYEAFHDYVVVIRGMCGPLDAPHNTERRNDVTRDRFLAETRSERPKSGAIRQFYARTLRDIVTRLRLGRKKAGHYLKDGRKGPRGKNGGWLWGDPAPAPACIPRPRAKTATATHRHIVRWAQRSPAQYAHRFHCILIKQQMNCTREWIKSRDSLKDNTF